MRGFNAFQLRRHRVWLDLTKASRTTLRRQGELGRALIERYTARFGDALAAIDAAGGDAPAKLATYAPASTRPVRGRRMCLCGMLAAIDTLADPMRAAVVEFFDRNEAWL